MLEVYEKIKRKIENEIFPAVPIPFKKNGEIDRAAQESYIDYMKKQPVGGFAVWVHTGRGLLITEEQRTYVMKAWREAFPDKLIIAGVGANLKECLNSEDPDGAYIKNAVEMAQSAKKLKADVLLVYAPVLFRGRDEKIIEYHKAIAEVGLPIILFYLYEEAGGVSYSKKILDELFSLKEVVGIKMATLDSVMTYQDISNHINEKFPDTLLITGEDRFFGYTIMRGARGALVGLGSACTALQKNMMDAYFKGNYKEFIKLSSKVDKLAECTFLNPMEGYIKRMLTVLSFLGVIPEEAAYDPFGPVEELEPEEKERIRKVLKDIGEL